jgi:hypothetical protein
MKNHFKHFIKYGVIILVTIGVLSTMSICMIKVILGQYEK